MNQAVIGFGSNIHPEINTFSAFEIISKRFNVIDVSPFIFTDPIGYTQQAQFLNGSILIETYYKRKQTAHMLKEIEKELGRKKSQIRFGPRTMDLDIVVWNHTVIDPDFYKRDFLKKSVLELVPDLQF